MIFSEELGTYFYKVFGIQTSHCLYNQTRKLISSFYQLFVQFRFVRFGGSLKSIHDYQIRSSKFTIHVKPLIKIYCSWLLIEWNWYHMLYLVPKSGKLRIDSPLAWSLLVSGRYHFTFPLSTMCVTITNIIDFLEVLSSLFLIVI